MALRAKTGTPAETMTVHLTPGWVQAGVGLVISAVTVGLFLGRLMFAPAMPTARSLDALNFKVTSIQDDTRDVKNDVATILDILNKRDTLNTYRIGRRFREREIP